MSTLKLSLLGPPIVELNGKTIDVKPRKALALLLYLACKGRRQPRDTLATLLWPDSGQRHARSALRRRLYELNQALGGVWLETRQEDMALADVEGLSVDVTEFGVHVAACRTHGHGAEDVCMDCLEPLTAAALVYRDDFLSGFTLSDCSEFDDWQFFQTEELRLQLAGVLARLVRLYQIQDNPAAAIPYARRRLTLDPLHEPAHRALMELYVQSGQQAAALRQYQLCADTLDAELGVSPDSETVQLVETIRAKRTSSFAAPSAETKPALTLPDSEEEPPEPQTPLQDELRLVTTLIVDVDPDVETEWDQQADEISERLSHFARALPRTLSRYEAAEPRAYGSGFQVFFGLHQMHEDDAERAIRAALAAQEEARLLGLDVVAGINTGMVYVSQGTEQADATVSGAAVQLAARLQSQSQAGEVLVGETTYDHAKGAYRFAPVTLPVRGSAAPVTAYRVVRPRRHAAKARGIEGLHSQLVGRDEEFAKLRAALEKLHQGQGQIVALVGEAGVGKSRLVAELHDRAQASMEENRHGPSLWLEGRCLEMNKGFGYWPFIDILQTYFGWSWQADEVTCAARVRAVLDELLGEEALTAEQVDSIGPVLGNLLSLRFHNAWDDWLQALNPEQVRFQTFVALRDFTVALAQKRPLVLVLEDIHWADTLSLELAAYLMEVVADTSILFLCVYRPEGTQKSGRLAATALRKCAERFTEIRLHELTSEASRMLIESLLHIEDLPATTVGEILTLCQGNPFFVEEVIHSLIEAGQVYRAGDVWRADAGVETTPISARVQTVVLSRFDRLAERARQVLQQAAVIGRLFQPRVLAEMVSSADSLLETLEELEERAFIYQEQIVPNTVYSFRHVLVQEAIYQMIPPRRRALLHRQVAESLEVQHGDSVTEVTEQLAHHYDQTDAVEKAIEYLLKAGEKARRAYLNEEAIGSYLRVLERLDAVDEEDGQASIPAQQQFAWRLAALTQLGQLHGWSAQYAVAEDYFRRAIVLGKETGLSARGLARFYFWIGELLYWQDRVDESIRSSEEALALLGDDVECAEAAMINAALAWGYLSKLDRERFCAYALRNVSFLAKLPYTADFRAVYGAVRWALMIRKRDEEALRWNRLWKELARSHHDLWSLGEAYDGLGNALLLFFGDFAGGREEVRRSADLFRTVGDPLHANYEVAWAGWLALHSGHPQEAESLIVAALETFERINVNLRIRLSLQDLAILHMVRHGWNQAAAVLQRRLLIEHFPVESHTWLGRVRLSQGRRDAARQHLGLALEAMVADDLKPGWRGWHMVGWRPLLVDALSALEETVADCEAFAAFCRHYRQKRPELAGSSFAQWHLEPVAADARMQLELSAHGLGGAGWTWHDPFGDCGYIEDGNGLIIQAANARDLWFLNRSAPRLLCSVEGDFAAQVTCQPAYTDRPAIGGILLWQDKENYLRLNIGIRGRYEVSLECCIGNEDIVIGRGWLPAEQFILYLEYTGDQVRTRCSRDGQKWHVVGDVAFGAGATLYVGLCAIGNINRTIYHDAFPEGTAIRFSEFRLMVGGRSYGVDQEEEKG